MIAVKETAAEGRKLYQTARETLMRSLQFAYPTGGARSGTSQALDYVRINAAARFKGLSYSTFIRGLKVAQIDIDGKSWPTSPFATSRRSRVWPRSANKAQAAA